MKYVLVCGDLFRMTNANWKKFVTAGVEEGCPDPVAHGGKYVSGWAPEVIDWTQYDWTSERDRREL